jgi:pimeloyl-ACP methyl ester carboxylesterase
MFAEVGRRFLFTVAVATFLTVGACQAREPAAAAQGELVTLADGRRINLVCSGHGAPTVILEGGYAATGRAWSKVQPVVAKTTRVCSYDRAGYGLSDPGPMPRDGAAVALDLDHALRKARVTGPFVLVGHSAGALYIRLFFDLRPKDVAGMVFVDPSVEHQDRRFASRFGLGAGSLSRMRDRAAHCLLAAEQGKLPSADPSLSACTPAPVSGAPGPDATTIARATSPARFSTEISELDTLWGATSDELDAGRRSFGDIPVIVLTAANSYADAPEGAREQVDAFWTGLHKELAAKSTRGSQRTVADSSHMMMFDRPDAICQAIEDVLAKAKR